MLSTVRRLTDRLSTGRGAIYHYVSGRDELLAAATDEDAGVSLRNVASGVFDAIVAHPWAGAHLAREPL